MKQNWLTETYTRIRESPDKELDHILSLFRPKAANDREIAEAVRRIGPSIGPGGRVPRIRPPIRSTSATSPVTLMPEGHSKEAEVIEKARKRRKWAHLDSNPPGYKEAA